MVLRMIPFICRQGHGLDQHAGFEKDVVGDIGQGKLGVDQACRHNGQYNRDIHIAAFPFLATSMASKQKRRMKPLSLAAGDFSREGAQSLRNNTGVSQRYLLAVFLLQFRGILKFTGFSRPFFIAASCDRLSASPTATPIASRLGGPRQRRLKLPHPADFATRTLASPRGCAVRREYREKFAPIASD